MAVESLLYTFWQMDFIIFKVSAKNREVSLSVILWITLHDTGSPLSI
jgi:hypothetical protein